MAGPTHLYEQIARNKRNSWLLMAGIGALLGIVGFAMGGAYGDPWAGMSLALAGSAFYSGISYFAGDSLVLLSMGAHEASREQYPQLYNVVEEMAIASGLPMPKVYVINSAASNAFATGRSPEKASVAITTGLMEILNREELQAVLAHEMGHVKNFDTRFAVLMAVMVGAVAMLCDASLRMGRRSRSRDSNGGGQAQLVFFLLTILLAIGAPIAAKAIQMAMSRKRELLADNTAAELTRNPGALANALEKIEGDRDPLDVANRGTQHLFIVNPVKVMSDHKFGVSQALAPDQNQPDFPTREEKAGWFDTHPPIALRIRLLREMEQGMGSRGG